LEAKHEAMAFLMYCSGTRCLTLSSKARAEIVGGRCAL
jgi:hypothetical protein